MKLSTKIKTHRLVFKQSFDEKPILLYENEAIMIKKARSEKQHFIELGDIDFSWNDILKVVKIPSYENIGVYDIKIQTPEEYHQEWQRGFNRKCLEYIDFTQEEKKEYAKKNPYSAFQFSFYEKNPNSNLKEQNKAFAKFVIANREKDSILRNKKILKIFKDFANRK